MTNVLPFPTNPVRHLSVRAADRLARRVDAMTARPSRPGVDRIADCLLALEASCFTEPCIATARNMAREMRVAVVMPGYDRLLTPDEAREVAQVLRAENAFAGAFGTARRLDDVADQAERRRPDGGPLNPRPNGSGRRFLILALLAAAAVAALRAFA
ncbi:hypothetical protein [Brevundimonas sp.]|uniref:hypothetical protein n=1 Tax=Brevundimonas sp. TaxID=1871086 RepID=UPI0025BBBB73|nr:hypothetical protein [Brevundimonas sp.]MCG2662891.1 hypothetical protein [Brevundimonas sp.]